MFGIRLTAIKSPRQTRLNFAKFGLFLISSNFCSCCCYCDKMTHQTIPKILGCDKLSHFEIASGVKLSRKYGAYPDVTRVWSRTWRQTLGIH